MTEDEEVEGLDLSQHAEVGYTFADRGGSLPRSHAAASRAEEPTGTTPAIESRPATSGGGDR